MRLSANYTLLDHIYGHGLVREEPDAGGGGGGAGGGAAGDGGAGSKGAKEPNSVEARLADLETKIGERDASIAKLTGDLSAANREAAEKRRLLERYARVGKPEDVDAIIAERSERERKDREARGAYEEQLQEERSNTATERQRAEEVVREYHSTMIERDILSAAASESARKQAMEPIHDGGTAQIVAVTRDLFEYDPETKSTLHKVRTNETGPRAGKRMTPREFFAAEKKSSLALYFQAALLPGGGGEGGDTTSGSDVVVIKRSAPNRVALLEAADKAKKRVTWVD